MVDNINDRKPIIVKNIKDADLDVVCIQELTQELFTVLQEELGKVYDFEWKTHKNVDHGVGILYRKAKFKKLAGNELNISCTVTNQSTKKESQKERTAMSMDLQNRTTEKVIRVMPCPRSP